MSVPLVFYLRDTGDIELASVPWMQFREVLLLEKEIMWQEETCF